MLKKLQKSETLFFRRGYYIFLDLGATPLEEALIRGRGDSIRDSFLHAAAIFQELFTTNL